MAMHQKILFLSRWIAKPKSAHRKRESRGTCRSGTERSHSPLLLDEQDSCQIQQVGSREWCRSQELPAENDHSSESCVSQVGHACRERR